MSSPSSSKVTPQIIIHGGAGSFSRSNLPPDLYKSYRSSLISILESCFGIFYASPKAKALDVATHAVTLLENDPLFNAGHGAVFTRAGTNELESSIMVSSHDGTLRKRGVGCMMLRHVKNPIKLARELLIRGNEEDGQGGGAYGHQQLSGGELERLAEKWGLEMVDPKYFFTEKRWNEHLKGLETERGPNRGEEKASEMYPQGTVGAVVLDAHGTICVATSTGGITNKLPGRIGDTPTLGAGFWADEWTEKASSPADGNAASMQYRRKTQSPLDKLSRGDISSVLSDCLPIPLSSSGSSAGSCPSSEKPTIDAIPHAIALSGTGNGDSFLRLSACRTASAISQFGHQPLQDAVTSIAGPHGELQKSAADRWGSGEGEGGMIGIERIGDKGKVVADFNCGGMWRAWMDEEGEVRCRIFRGEYEDEDEYAW